MTVNTLLGHYHNSTLDIPGVMMKKKVKTAAKKKPKRTIVAEEIELVDGKGRTRALLSTHEETGMRSLSFLDEWRLARVPVGMDPVNRAIFSMAGTCSFSRSRLRSAERG